MDLWMHIATTITFLQFPVNIFNCNISCKLILCLCLNHFGYSIECIHLTPRWIKAQNVFSVLDVIVQHTKCHAYTARSTKHNSNETFPL